MEGKALYLHREKRTGEGQGCRPALAVGLLGYLDVTIVPPILKVISTFTLTWSVIESCVFRFSYYF